MKSTKELVFNAIKDMKRGTRVNIDSLCNRFPGRSRESIQVVLWEMENKGYLSKQGRGKYHINYKTSMYDKCVAFKPAQQGKKKPGKKEIAERAEEAVKKLLDKNDVLQGLLEAMAKAEPEIRRLQDLERKVKTLTGSL